MALDARRIYVGAINAAALNEVLYLDVATVSVASFYAVPRYGASLGAWVCKIQHQLANSTPADFASAIQFDASTLYSLDKDMNGTDRVVFVNTTAGTSGIVDIYAIGKSDA